MKNILNGGKKTKTNRKNKVMRYVDLPITIREKAVANQIAQGNKRDVYRDIYEDDENSGGFTWILSNEGYEFWYNINENELERRSKKR